ncbi:MAG: hypothetical protein R6U68_16365 [Desulfobacteraceae bacterium]
MLIMTADQAIGNLFFLQGEYARAEKKLRSVLTRSRSLDKPLLTASAAHAYYKVDGKSPMEKFAVICSPDELPEISGMPESGMPLETWSKIINDLSRKSKIELSHEVKPVIEIGGTVRGKKPGGHQDQFVEDLLLPPPHTAPTHSDLKSHPSCQNHIPIPHFTFYIFFTSKNINFAFSFFSSLDLIVPLIF